MYPTIGKLFDQSVKKYPKKEALVDVSQGKRWSYEEWNQYVNRVAQAFISSGVRKGDIVSVFMHNTSEFATVYFACAKIGAVLNPINFRLKSGEVSYILNDSKPVLLIYEKALEDQVILLFDEFPLVSFWSIGEDQPDQAISFHERVRSAEAMEPEVELHENDLYAIMYTSGTTGQPKGVMHRHRDMIEQSLTCMQALQLRPSDRGLTAAPMFHCAELHCAFLPRIHNGCTTVILHHFDAKKVLDTIQREKITVMFGAPTMWNMMQQEDLSAYNLSSMRFGLYGGASMAPVLVRALGEKMGIQLVQAYGMTEMGPAISFLFEDEQESKAGSAGKACFNHEIRVVRPGSTGPSDPDDILPPGEPGEIIVRGPSVMNGYYRRVDATERALYKGWYHSGDIGYMDEDGYLFVSDRMDDMIVSGGENIYPREVEDVLYEHEGVLDVAVLGAPDDKWGERVTAIVVKKDETLTEHGLDEFCRNSSKLADYKRPRKFIFVPEMPRNASGKIQKYLLRNTYTELPAK
ncbi:fatty acid--CoA ligase [Fictibacillus enclensis]|uniref:fatty acid--CoA ligase n=1 Tax=Fictibacillus enclensis TaxID=1017270 RepID=UPI0025A2B998|nr:fatty acid--CoA ligase [Fictibacillus enclensis]MDM5197369.1 fatty acid--CoA ligase [Fictibacillus enclensis]